MARAIALRIPMRPEFSLRARITFAIAALTFVICSLFAAAVFFSVSCSTPLAVF